MCEVYDLCILYEFCREFTTGQDPDQAGGGGGGGGFQEKLNLNSRDKLHYQVQKNPRRPPLLFTTHLRYAIVIYVTGYEKRDHFAHFPNFHFKTLISLEL